MGPLKRESAVRAMPIMITGSATTTGSGVSKTVSPRRTSWATMIAQQLRRMTLEVAAAHAAEQIDEAAEIEVLTVLPDVGDAILDAEAVAPGEVGILLVHLEQVLLVDHGVVVELAPDLVGDGES